MGKIMPINRVKRSSLLNETQIEKSEMLPSQKDSMEAIQVVLDLLDGQDWADIVSSTGMAKDRAEEIIVIYKRLFTRYGG